MSQVRPVTCVLGSDTCKMARMTGLEPATSGVTGRRSTPLSYIRNLDPRETRGASDRSEVESCQRKMRTQASAGACFL
jgi:hypothetical protein